MYNDRGIIKWAPFDALVGFHQLIEEIKYRLGKKEKPLLSEDRLEEMNRHLLFALQFKKEVTIDYYLDGYFKQLYGYIKKVDTNRHMIVLEGSLEIDLCDILNIQTDGYDILSAP